MAKNTLYWNSEGKYQEEADQLEKLVPSEGHCQNNDVDLFRVASNIYYDILNNGGCNLNMDHHEVEVYRLEKMGFKLDIVRQLMEEYEIYNTEYGHEDEWEGDPDQFMEDSIDQMDDVIDEIIERIPEEIIEAIPKDDVVNHTI